MLSLLPSEILLLIFIYVDCREILSIVNKRFYFICLKNKKCIRSGLASVIQRRDYRLFKYINPQKFPKNLQVIAEHGSAGFIIPIFKTHPFTIVPYLAKFGQVKIIKRMKKKFNIEFKSIDIFTNALLDDTHRTLKYIIYLDNLPLYLMDLALVTPNIRVETLELLYSHNIVWNDIFEEEQEDVEYYMEEFGWAIYTNIDKIYQQSISMKHSQKVLEWVDKHILEISSLDDFEINDIIFQAIRNGYTLETIQWFCENSDCNYNFLIPNILVLKPVIPIMEYLFELLDKNLVCIHTTHCDECENKKLKVWSEILVTISEVFPLELNQYSTFLVDLCEKYFGKLQINSSIISKVKNMNFIRFLINRNYTIEPNISTFSVYKRIDVFSEEDIKWFVTHISSY